jgi:hypothetical protein
MAADEELDAASVSGYICRCMVSVQVLLSE